MPRGTSRELEATIGRRVKERRLYLRLSQDELAKKVGVTFQQMQKYESGTNRISVTRMLRIAESLGTSVDYFTKGLGAADKALADAPALSKECIELVRAYNEIQSPALRRQLVDMARALAKADARQGNSRKART